MSKLTITPQWKNKAKEKIEVFLNPTQYSISKSVQWGSVQSTPKTGSASASTEGTTTKLNAPKLTFGGGESRTITLNLFFDVTEKPGKKDVRDLTNQFVELTRKERADDKSSAPPICLIEWGEQGPPNSDFPFTGVVTKLDQNFTLFNSEGTPLRAMLTVAFREQINTENDLKDTDPEFTTYVVKRSDTLSSIAAKMYNAPAKWRVIAQANNLDDPRHLKIGATLSIPKIG
jgi:nucleoid-associated protein YgaU